MCDTFVSLSNATQTGFSIFAKNSDREPNEAQAIIHIPRKFYVGHSRLQTTYLTIPQVSETHEVYLSKPFWMWGAEMGVNEYGLAIGNEAVFTNVMFPNKKANQGLLGMDMLRLALERTKTTEEALHCITSLLEDYGQDACSGYTDKNFYYHNSFIICDGRSALVLETAGKHWVAEKVASVRSISNGLTIEESFDFHSKGLQDFALRTNRTKKHETFNFRKAFSDRFFTAMSKSKQRQFVTSCAARDNTGKMTSELAMKILRTHGAEDSSFKPSKSRMNSVCLHASGITTPSQTTGSMVVEWTKNRPLVWLTGTAAPCLSIFKPFFFGDSRLNETPGATADDSLWWTHEKFHRQALKQYPKVIDQIRKDQADIEGDFLKTTRELSTENDTTLQAFSKAAFQKALKQTHNWIAFVQPPQRKFGLYHFYWNRFNQLAGI